MLGDPSQSHEQLSEQEALQQTETLRQMIEAISSELELRPLLTKMVRYACDLLGADRGTVGLVNEASTSVRTEAAFNMPPTELDIETPLGVGIAGKVLATKEPLLLRRYAEIAQPLQPTLAEDAIIAAPVFWRGEMIGFFGLGAEAPRQFTPSDLRTLELFSRHAAIAIANAKTFEQEKRRAARMEAIGKIGQLITSSLSLSDILQTSVEAINDTLGFSSTGIFLVSPDNSKQLVLEARKGPGDVVKVGQYAQAFGEGNVGKAAQTGRAVFVADATTDSQYVSFPGAEILRSELALPITVADTLLGVLNVESEWEISQEDAAGLDIVVGQLGAAIDKAALFKETQTALDDMQLLYDSSQRISMAMTVESVVEAYLNQVAMRGRYRTTVAYFEYEGDKRTHIVRLGSWLPGEGVTLEPYKVPYFEDAFDPLLDAGQTVTMRDVAEDERASETLKQAQIKGGYPALTLIPLISRGQRLGVIALSYPRPHDWSADDLRPYQVTAAQLATAISSRLQQERLLEGEQQLALFEERQHIARELHDSVSQVVFSMTLVAQTIGDTLKRDPQEGQQRVERLLELSQKARAEMRALLAELRPETPSASLTMLPDSLRIREYGLVEALKSLLSEQGQGAPVVTLVTKGYKRSGLELEQMLYRVVQEALTNTVKHAEAKKMTIDLSSTNKKIYLKIEDDGNGFSVADTSETAGKHVGLNSMRERAEALGGTFSLDSKPGAGTRVRVSVPKQ